MANENEVRFLYTVCPKKPIKNLNDSVPLLRTSKSLFLTMEEVLKCLECGAVYRRFSNEGINEKTNKYDVERVHREKYISKEEWAKIKGNASDVSNLGVNGAAVIKEEIKAEPVVASEEPKVEEKAEEATLVVEEVVKEEEPTEEASAEEENTTIDDTTEEKNVENVVAATETEETNVDVEETVENDEITEDTVIEEEDIEAVDEVSENAAEDSAKSNVVVNYNNNGKKKKHH